MKLDSLARKLTFREIGNTRLNSSHTVISYAVFCLKKKTKNKKKKKIIKKTTEYFANPKALRQYNYHLRKSATQARSETMLN